MFSEMMHEQYRDLQTVSKLFQVADNLIVIGIARAPRSLSDHLEGVNGNQNRIRMLCDKGFDLLGQPVRNGTGRDSKENILRNILPNKLYQPIEIFTRALLNVSSVM